MKLTITGLAAGAAMSLTLIAPGAAVAGDLPKPKQIASKLCVAEKQADRDAFTETYGKHAMRDCKRTKLAEAEELIVNAAQTCRAEREADPDGFAATYGTNANGRNAFGKCVSTQVKEHGGSSPTA